MRVRLQQLRKACGFTQQTFADSIEMSRSHYEQIETGDKNPSLKTAIRIKRALGYFNDDLFDNVSILRRND